MKFDQLDSVTVPFDPGVAPCSKSSYHPREGVKGRYLPPQGRCKREVFDACCIVTIYDPYCFAPG